LFHLEIITPERRVFEGKVEKLSVPTLTGEITVLAKHVPLFTPLEMGEVKLTTETGKLLYFSIGKGILEVAKNKATLAIEDAKAADEISEKKAQEAMEKAKEILSQKPKDVDLLPIEKAFRRSFIDLKIARKRARKPKLSPADVPS